MVTRSEFQLFVKMQDKRFEDMNKRFEMMFKFISVGFGFIGLLMIILKFIKV